MASGAALLLVVCVFVGSAVAGASAPPAVPTAAQLAWSSLERGCLIHFNMQTFVPNITWNYIPGPQAFDPTALSTDNWVKACALYGGKYAVLVAKHADGFTLWPSKSYEPLGINYTVADSPFKHDIVAMFIESCAKYHVKPGIYCATATDYLLNISGGVPWTGNVTQAQYNQVVITQLTELWSQYGNLTEIWFDGGVLPLADGGPDVASLLNKLQPNAVAFQPPQGFANPVRWVGTEMGVAPVHAFMATTDAASCAQSANPDPFGAQWCPAESDTTLMQDDNWFWYPNPPPLRNLTELIAVYVQTVGRSTNLILDIAPNTTGILPQDAFDMYAAFGEAVALLFTNNSVGETAGRVALGDYLYLNFSAPQAVNLIELQEDLTGGQCIYNFELSSLDSHGSWHRVLADATVGHKRFVVPGQELHTSALRFRLITGWEGGGALTRFVARFSLAEEFRSLRETLASELKGM